MTATPSEVDRRGEQLLGTFCLLLGALAVIVARWTGGQALVNALVVAGVLMTVLRSYQLWTATDDRKRGGAS